MTPSLINPGELSDWADVRPTIAQPSIRPGVSVMGYRTVVGEVDVPGFSEHMIVVWRSRVEMNQRSRGRWTTERVGGGDISVMSRGESSVWRWDDQLDVDVVHVYLTEDELTGTAREMFGRELGEVNLRDVLRAPDPWMHRTAMLMADEAAHARPGGRLLLDSLSCQFIVQLLRRHAELNFVERVPGALADHQVQLVRDYVTAHLSTALSLQELADTVGLSRYHFSRRFLAATGTTPHEFVLVQRIARAQSLLHRTVRPLHDIAHECGFSDQSHMTRVFRRRLDVTPGRYRAQVG